MLDASNMPLQIEVKEAHAMFAQCSYIQISEESLRDTFLKLKFSCLTFISRAKVGTKDDEVGRISHGSLAEVVLLYLDPVALPRLVDTLQCVRKKQGYDQEGSN